MGVLLSLPVLMFGQDTIYFHSGERAVGELQSLDMGKLKFDSDDMGVVKVDIEDIASITTSGLFEVVFKDRTRHFGTFAPGDSAGVINLVEESGNIIPIDANELVTILGLEQGFWSKIDGSLDAGLNYTKASEVLQYNFGGRVTFKDKKWFTQISGSLVVTEQENSPNTRKSDAGWILKYSVIKRTYVAAQVRTEENSALGLDRRLVLGGAIGNDFVYTNVHRLYAQAGANSNFERAIDSADIIRSAEGLLAVGYLLYNSGVRDFYLDINATAYPSFDIAGRWRGEININPKVEIISDLNLGLQYYYIFDTEPVVETASSEDWGILSTLSYSF